ncbi:MAG: sulfotransferase [Emcibacter sp.]|nr:sulfotransferase [Emcibacter sp.]
MIFLFGAPRSGTSWLAKIFDSHPDVLYHHEPDSIIVSQDVPFFPESKDVEILIPTTRDYFTKLLNVRHLKSAASIPVFNKSYFTGLMNKIMPGLVFMLKTTSGICGKLKLPLEIKTPAFARKNGKNGKIVDVMKSVNSPCRTGLVAQAFPEAKVIYILRHPCGYVSSQLRGRELHFLENVIYYRQLASMTVAKERGWTEEKIKSMSMEEQLACSWVCINEQAMNDIEGQDNCMFFLYEDLCDEPIVVSRKLFDFCNLDYNDQTDTFLKSSMNYSGGNEKYFQTVRNPKTAAEKWKQELTAEQIEKIKNIVSGTKAGDNFLSYYG